MMMKVSIPTICLTTLWANPTQIGCQWHLCCTLCFFGFFSLTHTPYGFSTVWLRSLCFFRLVSVSFVVYDIVVVVVIVIVVVDFVMVRQNIKHSMHPIFEKCFPKQQQLFVCMCIECMYVYKITTFKCSSSSSSL